MNRRGFLGSILAACAAPAIVRADSLMRIVPMHTTFQYADNLVRAIEFPSAAEISGQLQVAAHDLWAHARPLQLDEYSRLISATMTRISRDMERRMLEDLYGRRL